MKQIVRYYLILLCLLAPAFANAQVSYKQFKKQSDLNMKSEIGLELWNYYTRSDLDSLKIAAIDLLLVASEKKHDFARAVGSRMLGSYLYRTGNIDQGLEYLVVALGFFEKREDFVVASEVWNEIGHAYQLDGALSKAKDAYDKSLRLGEQSTDATAAFNAKKGLGRTYILAGDTATGMAIWHSYKQSSLESKKYESVADIYAFMAMIEEKRNDKEQANEYYDRSIEFGGRSSSKSYIANRYANLGIRKFNLDELDSSLYFFEKSLELRIELNNMRQILEGYFNMGSYYLGIDSLDRAVDFFEIGIQLSKQHELWTETGDFLEELILLYAKRNDQTKVSYYENEKQEVKEVLERKRNAENDILKDLDLGFTEKDDKKVHVKEVGGVNWIVFVVVILAALLLFFLFLERKRFS